MSIDNLADYDGGAIIDEPTLLQRLPISSRTARDWRRRKILPFIKPPGSYIIMYHWPTVQEALIRLQTRGN